MPKKLSKPKKKKTDRRTVIKLAPEAPAARDEGPRLIPLGPEKEEPRLKHLLDLADSALGTRTKDTGKS